MKMAEVLSIFFALIFAGSQDFHIHEPYIPDPEPLGGNWGVKSHPL